MTALANLDRRGFLKTSTALVTLCAAGIVIPKVLRAATHTITLDVTEVNGSPTYNGLSPGPTIYAAPGDIIDVHLINSLPRLDDDCTDSPNSFHGLNTTNFHTHGLHVSPTTDSSGEFDADNVYISITPKDQFVPCDEICGESVKATFRNGEAHYRFEIGEDHATGTFWYHAHKHGSTARQVGAGLSGPLIITDRAGDMPDYIADAPERIIMLMNQGVVLVDPAGGGTLNPTITLQPGQVERWRVINAQTGTAGFSYLQVGVPSIEMYLIAFDGLTLDNRVRVEIDNNEEPWLNPAALAPGNRADFMVRVPLDADADQSSFGLTTGIGAIFGLGPSTTAAQLSVGIAGDPIDALWSDDVMLPGSGLIPFDDTALSARTIQFSPQFTIGNEAFDGDTKQTMDLGTAEEWTIQNATGGIHVFHIHVNPFFITHINGQELPANSPLRRWQDTIGLPTGTRAIPGTVRYKTRFETFKGKFVIHCHILRHEDMGMMQTVEVV
jgi:FtsP/CotA-like multicopper oxidase with cupredoxin domain